MNSPVTLSRRLFLIRSAQAGAGLTLGVALNAGAADGYTGATGKAVDDELAANAFVTLKPDNTVIITSKHMEMGQGTFTGMATIAAEELDADWSRVETVSAPSDSDTYKNLIIGMQLTGGSTSIANSWTQMREAGAAVRQMLLAAAAKQWQVPVGELTTDANQVIHGPSGRKATYGELSTAAAAMPLPDKVTLKDPKDFKLVGKQFLPRKDVGKTDGSATFTQDVRWPGMLTAVVAHPPVFGGTVKSVNADRARAMPGVKAVLEVPSGVAVLADTFWQALQARKALDIVWDEGEQADFSTAALLAQYRELAGKPGLEARNDGDAAKVLAESEQVIDAEFAFPYLAHAAMEPMNCVIQRTDKGADLWFGSQGPAWDQVNVAKVFGIKPEDVNINILYAGGSFGRRATADGNYVTEAAHIARAYGQSVPIKLVWTREDDNTEGHYRPMYVHRIRAALDEAGNVTAWHQNVVGQSIRGLDENTVDRTSVEGAANLPYAIPNIRVDSHNTVSPVAPHWWRSVGSTHSAFAVETFVDELAHAAGKDPVEFRMALLRDHPRHRAVLQLAAEKAGWGKPLPEGHFHGIAVHESFSSYVAQVAEVAQNPDGKFRIVKITCAVDCGVAVNPDVIKAQMAGGIGYGLSPLMFSEITVEKGRVQEANFDRYRVLRMNEMPAIDVHIVPSGEAPTGVGEPGTPVGPPAVANAIFAATGKRIRQLPATEFFA
ncbi:MAG: twin-arginine translocation pathway signal protein [Porticoccaceae bacterium]|nr:twin-arginine translocation pathway signal protein [Porticoccaceae bacterium]